MKFWPVKHFSQNQDYLQVPVYLEAPEDVFPYLFLQKEFQTIKSTLMKGKYRDLIENRQKINVNDQTFNIDMKECLDDHKLSILGKIKKNTDNS